MDRSEVARDLIRRLDRWYARVLRQGVGSLGDAWRIRTEHLDRVVRVSTPEGLVRADSGARPARRVDLELQGDEAAPRLARKPAILGGSAAAPATMRRIELGKASEC